MRLLKKYIRKLYHLIWFLGAFVIFIPRVNADVTIDGALFTQSSDVTFADNTNNNLTNIGATFISNGSYWRSNDAILTNGANIYGANFAFYSAVPFVQGHIYAVSVLIGMANVSAKASSTRLCIAETVGNAITRNNLGFPCTTAIVTSSNTSTGFTADNITYNYTILSYIFTAEFTSNALTASYNTNGSNQSNHTFGGYIVRELSSQPLTQSQITSAVQNSGLATANSVSQVQSSINQIQTDINSSANNIINNNNQNTQDIINSSGSNTQSIIDNQNENSNKEIESQKVCSNKKKNFTSEINNSYLASGGSIASNNSLSISNYLSISQNKSYTVEQNRNINGAYLCIYKEDKTLSRCISWNTFQSRSFTSSSDEYFVRTTFSNSSTATLTGYICENGNQAIDDSLNNIDDTLNNSSVDSSDNTINNLKNQIPTNSVISDLLLLPVRFLQNFVNALGSSCSQFSLGSLYGTELFMPCISIENYLGSGIWTAIDLIISGMFVYALRKKFIEIYENMTNLRNGGNEVD